MLGAYITGAVTVLIVLIVYKAAFARRKYLYRLQKIGMATPGTVIDIKLGEDSDGDTTYAPVIAYTTYDGKYRSHTMSASTSNRKKLGTSVPVIYDPAYPNKPEFGTLHPERVLISATIGALVVIGLGVIIALSLLGVIQSNSDGSDSAALLLPLPIVMAIFTRSKGLVGRA